MRLRQLKISGFKSFADTVVIDFPGAFSGIVGPNGCGKSNVIDAIRWVLGEGRITELRGSSSMTELIFAGSSNRPASSRASVEMVLDNADGRVGGPWASYAELSIKRVMTRDGSNAYIINGQQVRRRDVQDIFMGTGLGPRSYAIISQGMISNFIKAKPEELRVYLEEAAGVSKYKERRKETESALTRTRENLERVDMLQQTKAQEVERLTGEAEVARRWRELDDERERSEILWHFVQESDAKSAIDKLTAEIAQKEEESIREKGRADDLERRIEELKNAAQEKRALLETAKRTAWDAEAKLREAEGAIAHIAARRDSLTHQISSMAERLERRRIEQDVFAQRIRELEERAAECTRAAEESEEEVAALQEEWGEKDEAVLEAKRAYEAARDNAQKAQNRIAVVEIEIDTLSRESTRISEQIASLKNEIEATAAPDENRAEELRELLEEKRAELEECAASVEELTETLGAERECLTQALLASEAAAKRVTSLSARIDTLTGIQQKALAEGKLPAWLRKMGLEAMTPFYKSLQIEEGWSLAAEAVLSVRAHALPVGDLKRASGFVLDPPPGRLAFYGLDTARVEQPDAGAIGLRPLADFVRTRDARNEPALSQWLSGVYAAESLEEALRSREKLQPAHRIVTREGHIVDAASISFWAEESVSSGILSRQAEIESLGTALTEAQGAAEEAAESVKRVRSRVDGLDSELRTERSRETRERDALHALEVEYTRLSGAIAAYKSRSEKVKNDIESLSRRASEVEKNRAEAEERFASLDESLSELQQAELTAQQSLEKAQRESEAMQSRIRDLKEQANLSRVKERDAIEHKAETEKSAESAREETLLMTEEREALAEELAQLNATAQVEGLASFIAERDRTKTEEIAAQEMSDTAENALEAARSEQRSILDAQVPRQQAIADLQVKRQAWVTQTQTFTAAIDASGEDRTELARIVVREKLKAGTLKNRVAKLVEEIAALGPVNHAALENLEASRKAMAETARQVEDLNEAIENLEATIRKIDAETRTLLKNTFETVSTNFTQMFKDLFGGGTASLTMTGEEILDCGVEVRAQPPGKRNASVKLLSGGEQALTATALVFAIFSLNPAPFCLLDEVDAPLDEANQDRLARQIIAMSGSTQFMMITHHRVTMEYLKRLVGVTMKEPGVSRVVAVDVAEGSRLAAS